MRMSRFVVQSACVLAMVCGGSAYAEKIRLVYSDVESELYQLGNGTQIANPPGAAIEILNQAAKEAGVEIEYVRLPVKRSFDEMQQGKVDGGFMYSFKEERLPFGQYPMKAGKPNPAYRMTTLTYSIYKLAGSAVNWDGKAFTGVGNGAVGFNSTYSVGSDLAKLNVRTEEAKTTEQNFQKLQTGRIVAYAMQDHTADLFISEHKLTNIEKIPAPLSSKEYYLMLSNQFVQKNPALAEKLWQKVGEVRDAKLKEILKKYM
ncbi:substrate-binding periplasmic protein [Parachitinimonas caeni]|uniref:Transporter substrate-binding domain-containing protein n=1 Tax=Parachitinimonas caeni TaxID=3031301 RepID=A0ABT7DUE5_9NEIS|nr:transporter substrate-binding domain-containing protein [Parachitinimonas caeni]MDK2123708.1 transporter substrate-binding domain-containing protein [Parachitinimonas caeni]